MILLKWASKGHITIWIMSELPAVDVFEIWKGIFSIFSYYHTIAIFKINNVFFF